MHNDNPRDHVLSMSWIIIDDRVANLAATQIFKDFAREFARETPYYYLITCNDQKSMAQSWALIGRAYSWDHGLPQPHQQPTHTHPLSSSLLTQP